MKLCLLQDLFCVILPPDRALGVGTYPGGRDLGSDPKPTRHGLPLSDQGEAGERPLVRILERMFRPSIVPWFNVQTDGDLESSSHRRFTDPFQACAHSKFILI